MSLRKRWFAWIYPRVHQAQRAATAPIRRDLLGDLHGHILDVGCGPGTNFEHYPVDARVTAIDYNAGMVSHARRELATLTPPHAVIEVEVADATALPYPDASFDAYVSTLVLCSVVDLDRAVEEAWRVLKPGAALRIFEHVRSESAWKARLQRAATPAWGLVADGCHLDRQPHVAFAARGFEVIDIQRPRIPAEPFPLVVLKARKPGRVSTP